MIGMIATLIAVFLMFVTLASLLMIRIHLPHVAKQEELVMIGVLIFGALSIMVLLIMGAESHYVFTETSKALRPQ